MRQIEKDKKYMQNSLLQFGNDSLLFHEKTN